MNLRKIWSFYLAVQRGRGVSSDIAGRLRKPGKMDRAKLQSCGRALVVIDAGRVGDRQLIARVVDEKNELLHRACSDEKIFMDVALTRDALRLSGMRFFAVKAVFRHPLAFLCGALLNFSAGCGWIMAFRAWLRQQQLSEIELFSSNSRLIELLRIAAILDGISVTEFLHGICSDIFGDYYSFLDVLACESGAELRYVNMLPRLPQPDVVRAKLIRKEGVEAYFRNERPWEPSNGADAHDVLIVGSGAVDGDFLRSDVFHTERRAAEECMKRGLKVVYGAHPFIADHIGAHLPAGVTLGTVARYANSARLMLGHFSTVLFNSKLMGGNVLIFEGAWSLMPTNLAVIFEDQAVSTYSLERALGVLKDLPPNLVGTEASSPAGYNLAGTILTEELVHGA